jgi:hypothetical protein
MGTSVGPERRVASIDERVIPLGPGLPAIPERLLLAHARGEVLFIAGAGVSKPAGLPDFRELVIKICARLDAGLHTVIKDIPRAVCNRWQVDCSSLTNMQAAEVNRLIAGTTTFFWVCWRDV